MRTVLCRHRAGLLVATPSVDNENGVLGAMSQFVQIGVPQTGLRAERLLSSAELSRRIVWLQAVPLAWVTVEGGVSLASAAAAHSPALLAFGADSFVELVSAVIVLLQFLPSCP